MDVGPYDAGLLCVSCQWAIRLHICFPVDRGDGRGLVIVRARATPENPLGYEGDGSDWGVEFRPRTVLPDLTDTEESEIRGEVYDLYFSPVCGPRGKGASQARDVVEELRKIGQNPELDTQLNLVRIDAPRRVPHLLLVRFVELQYWIADVLSRERAERNETLTQEGLGSGEREGENLSTLPDATREPSAGTVLAVLLHAGRKGTVSAHE